MASSAKACFILFLLTLLSSQQILARESQFFNKVPSNNNNNVVAEVEPNKQEPLNKPEQEPNFIPENENGGYGLYGHETGQFPPSTTTNGETHMTTANIPYNTEVKESFPNSKYLPKNYNTQAYVTEPEGYTPTTTTTPDNTQNNYSPFSIPNSKYVPKNYNTQAYVTEPEGYTATEENNYNHNNFYNGENYYNNNQQQGYTTSANGNNYNNNHGGNSYNSFAQKGYTTTGGSNNYNYYNGGNSNGYQKQGMSDTRFLEHGRYFHDISLEKSNHNPYNTRGFGSSNEYNNRGYYVNENSYGYNNAMEGYQNQEQFQNFQDEEDMP